MNDLSGKNAIVIGCTGGVGQSVTSALIEAGTTVLGVARNRAKLEALTHKLPDLNVKSIDATNQSLIDDLIQSVNPDIVVVALGAEPHMAPVGKQTWESFVRPWETDMKATFNVCHSALNKPLLSNSKVILISGGPGLGSSPLSGGLSTSKSGQLFLADACQWQSQKENLGIRFQAIAPKRMMPMTAIGKVASEGYANYLGVSVDEFMGGQSDAQTADDVGPAVITALCGDAFSQNTKLVLDANGLSAV